MIAKWAAVVFREGFVTRFLLFDETFGNGEKKLDGDFYESNKIWVLVVKKTRDRFNFWKDFIPNLFFQQIFVAPRDLPWFFAALGSQSHLLSLLTKWPVTRPLNFELGLTLLLTLLPISNSHSNEFENDRPPILHRSKFTRRKNLIGQRPIRPFLRVRVKRDSGESGKLFTLNARFARRTTNYFPNEITYVHTTVWTIPWSWDKFRSFSNYKDKDSEKGWWRSKWIRSAFESAIIPSCTT